LPRSRRPNLPFSVSLPDGAASTYSAGNGRCSKIEDTGAEAARRALHADLGERIVAIRKGLGVGQAERARGAGIDVSSMFRIEKGS
jgi:hypothetical protein